MTVPATLHSYYRAKGSLLGNLVGPFAFKPYDAPRYPEGFIVVVVTSIAAGVAVIIYRGICVRLNRKRDRAGVEEGFEHAYEDDLTDLKVCSPRVETI